MSLATKTYDGVWSVLIRLFRVPREAPGLPESDGETVDSFRPAAGWLAYMKLPFWIGLAILDGALFFAWLAVFMMDSWWGTILAPLFVIFIILPDVAAYVMIHLRYDTTWYVMSRRSLRLRKGIWTIRETTVTFENVQNLRIDQGPLQRYFGIADLVIETAGGGAMAAQGMEGLDMHTARIEGIADASALRDRIMKRVRDSGGAGLGDEHPTTLPATYGFPPAHVEVLKEIRDLACNL